MVCRCYAHGNQSYVIDYLSVFVMIRFANMANFKGKSKRCVLFFPSKCMRLSHFFVEHGRLICLAPRGAAVYHFLEH